MSQELAVEQRDEETLLSESNTVSKPELSVLRPQYEILDNIHTPHDVKKLNPQDLGQLANEIRDFLILNIAETGGHLAPN